MKIAVVGATGMVGNVMLNVLEEHNFPVTELIPAASERSVGSTVKFKGKDVSVVSLEDALKAKPAIALFSAGSNVSLEWAPKFRDAGIFVVDNSSAWRMNTEIKLVVPEINATSITKEDKIIANPNCSTIQMVMVLNPLHKKYKAKRAVISTYQSVTGTGVKAVQQMENERGGKEGEKAYVYQIDRNCLPHCDVFVEEGYTKEEMKLVNETRKILSDNSINITATAVRVPVVGGHSESVNLSFENDFELEDIKSLLKETKGVTLMDDIQNNIYPMPLTAQGKDDVFVGRIRRDFSFPNSLNLWIVADNLRKGAATNAVQIAQYLVDNNLVDQ